MAERDAVTDTLQRINDAWLNGRAIDMLPLVHPEVVVVLPGFSGRVIGRDAFVASYGDFAAQARVFNYDENEHVVDVFGDTAIVSYRYEIEYEIAERWQRDTGRDFFVFNRQPDGCWQVVWRTVIPEPESLE
jgi:ketosteroid isomerase-like protein